MKSVKLTLFFICSSFFSFNLFSQTFTLPMENARWTYERWLDGDFSGRENFAPDSIVTVNQTEYAVINDISISGWDYIYYREENGRVYVLPQDSIQEFLVYDFNLEIGDKFYPKWGVTFDRDSIVLDVVYIQEKEDFEGNVRNEFYLQGEDEYSEYGTIWLDGIGDTAWPFFYPHYQFGLQLGGFYTLGCFSEVGVNYVLSEQPCGTISSFNIPSIFEIIISPNPSNSIFFVSTDEIIQSCQVINLNGEIIYSASPNSNSFTLNLEKYYNGIYYLKLGANGHSSVIKKIYKF